MVISKQTIATGLESTLRAIDHERKAQTRYSRVKKASIYIMLFPILVVAASYTLTMMSFEKCDANNICETTTHFPLTFKVKERVHTRNALKEGAHEKYFWTGRLASQENYRAGELDGLSLRFNKNGTRLYEGHFKAGAKHGSERLFYKNGSVKAVRYFEEGLRAGGEHTFHKNGMVASFGRYSNDKQEGTFFRFSDIGNIIEERQEVVD